MNENQYIPALYLQIIQKKITNKSVNDLLEDVFNKSLQILLFHGIEWSSRSTTLFLLWYKLHFKMTLKNPHFVRFLNHCWINCIPDIWNIDSCLKFLTSVRAWERFNSPPKEMTFFYRYQWMCQYPLSEQSNMCRPCQHVHMQLYSRIYRNRMSDKYACCVF